MSGLTMFNCKLILGRYTQPFYREGACDVNFVKSHTIQRT